MIRTFNTTESLQELQSREWLDVVAEPEDLTAEATETVMTREEVNDYATERDV